MKFFRREGLHQLACLGDDWCLITTGKQLVVIQCGNLLLQLTT